MQVLRKGTYQCKAGLIEKEPYFDNKYTYILVELAQNLQQYTTNYTEALHYLNEYVSVADPTLEDQVIVFVMKAKISLKRGKIEIANIFIDQALEIAHFYNGLLLKGNILMELNKWSEAEQFYSQALAMRPAATEARIALSNAITMTLDANCRFRKTGIRNS